MKTWHFFFFNVIYTHGGIYMERKNIYIVILTITTIIASCFAIYFAVNPIVNENEKINNNDNIVLDEIKEEVDTSTEKVEEKESEDLNNATTSDSIVTEKIVYQYKRPTVDVTKCINPREGTEYALSRSTDSTLGLAILQNSKEVNLWIRWDNVPENVAKKPDNANKYEIINNFSGNVIDVYILGYGQGVDEYLFFLMEDGTVEYMPLDGRTIGKNEYRSYGKIDGVENVVELLECGNSGTTRTPIALTKDGSFYDLGKIINEMR